MHGNDYMKELTMCLIKGQAWTWLISWAHEVFQKYLISSEYSIMWTSSRVRAHLGLPTKPDSCRKSSQTHLQMEFMDAVWHFEAFSSSSGASLMECQMMSLSASGCVLLMEQKGISCICHNVLDSYEYRANLCILSKDYRIEVPSA